MKTNRLKQFALIAFMALGLTACSDDDNNNAQPDNTIAGIASRTANLSSLVAALNRAELTGVLSGSGNFTVFAPTNDAFAAFLSANGFANVDAVPVPVLKNLLLNHVIGTEIASSAIPPAVYVSTLSPINSTTGAPTISMFVQKSGNTVTINGGASNGGSTVATADIDASNGIIHVVSNVIAIPKIVNHVVANPQFDTLQAVVTSGASGAFGDQSAVLAALNGLTASAPATVFAPDNAAFTAATTGTGFAVGATPAQVSKVLQYHVTVAGNVRSNQLTNNQSIPMITSPVQNTTVILGSGTVDIRDTQNNLARVNQADVQCSNGVIHGVNRVLQP
jgi:uncharacterized surface protein with fasciclin (FAS1) repeats